MAVFFIAIYKPFQKQNWFLTRVLRFWSTSLCFHRAAQFFEKVPIDFA